MMMRAITTTMMGLLMGLLLVGGSSALLLATPPMHSGRGRATAGASTQQVGNRWAGVSTRVKTRMGSELRMAAGSSAPKIIIAGAPASGKGTQCELIKEKLGVVHLSTGDMLRAAVKEGTPVGLSAKSYMDSGKLVPDEVIIGVVKERLQLGDCQEKGWLLDGFPRTAAQADALAKSGVSADCFILLEVPDEMLIERVVGRRMDPETGAIYHVKFSPPPADVADRVIQRSDDTEEKARVRLEQYHSNIEAVRSSYETITKVIDGTKAKADVFGTIQSHLESLVKSA